MKMQLPVLRRTLAVSPLLTLLGTDFAIVEKGDWIATTGRCGPQLYGQALLERDLTAIVVVVIVLAEIMNFFGGICHGYVENV